MIDTSSLEFELFKTYIEKTLGSRFSVRELNLLKPMDNIDEISIMQGDLSDALEYVKLKSFSAVDDEEYFNIYQRLRDPLVSFEPHELLIFSHFLRYMAETIGFIGSEEFENLFAHTAGISNFSTIISEIDSAINSKGEVKDDATDELKKIRDGLRRCRKDIHKSLNGIMNGSNSDKFVQEQVITERSGRFTIPCKTNFRQYFQGIVHDRSGSGQTFFVEPSSTVSMNNEHHELMAAEREEVLRILKALVDMLVERKEEIFYSTESFAKILFRLETAKFYKKRNYVFPEFGDDIYFDGIHHPIIVFEKGEESVPLDLKITEKLVVITGPNTGGKTAALKSIGLNHIIGKCGLPLIGGNARLINATGLLADIGDKQSLVMDLSTFSSHMVNIKEIIEHADSGAIVFLDEAGTGTEPNEGAALAIAICDKLVEKGATVFLTTHFAEVKNFAQSRNDASIFAVEFDYQSFMPKYRLLKSVVGKSDPLLIAERLGFPVDVINAAREIVKDSMSLLDMNLDEVNALRSDIASKQNEVNIMLRNAQRRVKELDKREAELTEKLNKREAELLEETNMLLTKAKRLAKKGMKAKEEDVDIVLQQADNKLKKVKKKVKPVEGIQVGDTIFLEKYRKTGKVLEIEGNKVYMDLGGLRIHMNKQDVVGSKVTDKIKVKGVKVSKPSGEVRKRELVIVGKRVEEGVDILDKFLDESTLSGYDQLIIVHGRGSGQLKNGVHEFLKKDARVKQYRIATNEEGGAAITIVSI